MKRTNILIIGILAIFAAALLAIPVAAELPKTYFEGIVIDQNGDPVDSATVVLEFEGPDIRGSLQTDSNDEGGPGTWYLYPYIGVDYTLYAYIADTPYDSIRITGTTNESYWTGITLVLDMSGDGDEDWTYLEGYVIDQNENPIEGAIVYLEYGNSDDRWYIEETYSDEDGYFSFDVPVGADYYLQAYLEDLDLSSNEIEGEIEDEMSYQILEIDMGTSGTATAYGKVFDSSNYPVDGATVYLVYEDEDRLASAVGAHRGEGEHAVKQIGRQDRAG
jgi:protocatechuate 3,4-dioxygenase beta subunit